MYRFDFVRMKQINAQTGYERSMKRFGDAQAAPAAAASRPRDFGLNIPPAKRSKPSPAPAAAPVVLAAPIARQIDLTNQGGWGPAPPEPGRQVV